MGTRARELVLLIAACALALGEPIANKTSKGDADNFLYQYEDYDSDPEEVVFNENKPCPRDCICTVSQGYRIAKCNRLEVGVQKFGDDITDLVLENIDPRYPIDLDDFIFKKLGLHNMATVKIVNSTIGSIGPKAFYGLHELYAVHLSNNKLKNLHPETFAFNRKLLLLTLANNPLKFPAVGSDSYFLNATSVQELDVSYCNMKYITPSTFQNMPSLMYLNVAGNSLSDLDPNTFKDLLDLEELDLTDNNISSLPDDIFSENTELATLHIQRNPIYTVYGLKISDCLTLNAGQTSIKFVGPSMFNGMPFIANLNLSGNHIAKIHNQAFHTLKDLNYLDLSYNDLDFISSILIKENIELDIFKISNNPKLKHLPENGFECSAQQFNIYLFDASNCGLEEIQDNSLSTFTALSQINLSGNKIRMISAKVFSRIPKLVEVNLANNLLTTLDSKVFEQNKELTKLYLQGNPLMVLSATVFSYTPELTLLDMSHTEITSLWKEEKNQKTALLSKLRHLNTSFCRITEIKKSEIEGLHNLHTLDISNNPLACSREFEDLMTLLSSRNVSPNSYSASIANLARDTKEEESTYSWEFLAKKICGADLPHKVEVLPTAAPVSDEEIWERIDGDAEGNFDLKDTLDDGKIADDTKLTNKKDKAEITDDAVDDDADDEEGGDDYKDDDDDDDDAAEEYDDDGFELTVSEKTTAKSSKSKLSTSTSTASPVTDGRIKIDIKLLENDSLYDDRDDNDVEVLATLRDDEHDRYEYLWPMLIAVLSSMLVLVVIGKAVMMVCSRRSKQVRYNSAIIAAMGQQGRTKKDCGLVYQQLSEDLKGPATPKLSRYQPLHNVTVNAANMSYESSPFHHNNIVPEAV